VGRIQNELNDFL